MPLSTAEHRAVQRLTKAQRNSAARNRRAALARAWAWIQAMDAEVIAESTPTGLYYTVHVPGFHPATAQILANAVDALDHNIATFCNSPAVKGPTGARIAPLCERRAAYRAHLEGLGGRGTR